MNREHVNLAGRWGMRASTLAVALLLVAVATTVFCRAAFGETSASAPVATAEEVLRQVVERDGTTYAGDCATTRSPQDLGKVCSRLIEQRGNVSAYLTGRTFSEFNRWVFVEQTDGGWNLRGTATLDFLSPSLDIPWP